VPLSLFNVEHHQPGLLRRLRDRLLPRIQAWLVEITPRRAISLMLLLAGAGLLLYVSSEYATMYLEQRSLAQQWAEQNRAGAPAPPSGALNDGLTKVRIPKINVDAIVVEGISNRQLLLGPGHMPETPAPGEVGNSVITAHRDTFFRHIYELNKGDDIEVRRNGRVFTYKVTGKKVVKPEDLTVLRQTQDKRLTLITCYPTYYIGPAPERLVVHSKLVEDPASEAVAATSIASRPSGNQ
jgi:LPXTG-site transpeptidase (sortase) family protein